MEKFTFLGKKVAMSAFLCCFSLVGFAQEDTMVEGAVSIFKESPQLVRTLKSPVVPVKNKHAILGKIFREPGFSGLMVNFLKKACDAGCIGQMEDIADAWRSYSLGKEGIMEAELHYVTMPGAAQIAGMKQFLCRIYHKKDITLNCNEQGF